MRRLTRQRVVDKVLRADVESTIIEFGGCTKTRNFYCHAAYGSDDQARLMVAHSINLSDSNDEASPIRDPSRPLDRANLREIAEAARRLADLNPVLWKLVARLEDALQVPLAKRQRIGA